MDTPPELENWKEIEEISKKEFDNEKHNGSFESYEIGEHFILCKLCGNTTEGETKFKYYRDGKTLIRKGECSNCRKEIEEIVSK